MITKEIEKKLLNRKNFNIKIGDIDYLIKFDEDHTNINNCFGEHSLNRQIIFIQPGINDSKILHTFIHEVLHGMFAVSGISYKKEIEEVEEEIIRTLSEHINLFRIMN